MRSAPLVNSPVKTSKHAVTSWRTLRARTNRSVYGLWRSSWDVAVMVRRRRSCKRYGSRPMPPGDGTVVRGWAYRLAMGESAPREIAAPHRCEAVQCGRAALLTRRLLYATRFATSRWTNPTCRGLAPSMARCPWACRSWDDARVSRVAEMVTSRTLLPSIACVSCIEMYGSDCSTYLRARNRDCRHMYNTDVLGVLHLIKAHRLSTFRRTGDPCNRRFQDQ